MEKLNVWVVAHLNLEHRLGGLGEAAALLKRAAQQNHPKVHRRLVYTAHHTPHVHMLHMHTRSYTYASHAQAVYLHLLCVY
jgi:hypothetical protein